MALPWLVLAVVGTENSLGVDAGAPPTAAQSQSKDPSKDQSYQVSEYFANGDCTGTPSLVLFRQVPTSAATAKEGGDPECAPNRESGTKQFSRKEEFGPLEPFENAKRRFANNSFVLVFDQSVSGTSNCAQMRYLGATAMPVNEKCTPVYDHAGNFVQSTIVKVTAEKIVVGKYWDETCQEGTVTEITREASSEPKGYCKHANLYKVFDGKTRSAKSTASTLGSSSKDKSTTNNEASKQQTTTQAPKKSAASAQELSKVVTWCSVLVAMVLPGILRA